MVEKCHLTPLQTSLLPLLQEMVEIIMREMVVEEEVVVVVVVVEEMIIMVEGGRVMKDQLEVQEEVFVFYHLSYILKILGRSYSEEEEETDRFE